MLYLYFLLASAWGQGDMGSGNPLPPCPDRPNCVRSGVEPWLPLEFETDLEEAQGRLSRIMERFPRCNRIAGEPLRWRYQCRSRIFGFIDELEFLFSPQERRIHYRSAARTGYWDLGINAKRLRTLLRTWASPLEKRSEE